MNSQFSYLQSLGFFQTDWSSVLFFLVVGTIYFLAPTAGYLPTKRGVLVASMWAMILKLAIGIFRECLFTLQALNAPPPLAANAWNVGPAQPAPIVMQGGFPFANAPSVSTGAGGILSKFEEQLPALLTLAETVAFLAAIILFVFGLQKLIRREAIPSPGPQNPDR